MSSRSYLSMVIVRIYNPNIIIYSKVLFFRTITRDDSLVYEAKHVFRYLLATVIRRLHSVR